MAPCNCGGSKSRQDRVWIYSLNGVTRTFNSEIEAKAAQIRSGGGGTITTALK